MKIKNIVLMLLAMTISFSAFAAHEKLIACKDLAVLSQVKQRINKLDQQFQWESPSCRIVETRSLFPRQGRFEKGVQLFIYQNDQLKFICLPGWVCRAW